MATVTNQTHAAERQHIVRASDICGGKPTVVGTRIRVWDIYQWYELGGATPNEIIAQYPQLTLADVHAAMAYFWDHEAEIRTEMAESEASIVSARSASPSKLDRFRP